MTKLKYFIKMEKETNLRIFDWLYEVFIEEAETDPQRMERFLDEINSIFEDNNKDTRIEIGNTLDLYDFVAPKLIKGRNFFSTHLIMILVNFLFNMDEDTWIIFRDEGELDTETKRFNTYAEEIGSKIRIIPYEDGYRATLTSSTKLE